MSLNVIILLCFIGLSHSAVMIYQVKEGGQVILDLGPNVVTWGRQRNNGNEYIKYCKAEDKKTWCKQFVGEDNKPALPESNALLKAAGHGGEANTWWRSPITFKVYNND
ncbi:hypothetical protein GCK32_011151 [Trichostrongylus colubriformis]|uniref:Uncharacterized protein n=1 Tax=Trichostrongylus colubriformis TaxID=6319 RepID=A0AAN8G6F5_TRICO